MVSAGTRYGSRQAAKGSRTIWRIWLWERIGTLLRQVGKRQF